MSSLSCFFSLPFWIIIKCSVCLLAALWLIVFRLCCLVSFRFSSEPRKEVTTNIKFSGTSNISRELWVRCFSTSKTTRWKNSQNNEKEDVKEGNQLVGYENMVTQSAGDRPVVPNHYRSRLLSFPSRPGYSIPCLNTLARSSQALHTSSSSSSGSSLWRTISSMAMAVVVVVVEVERQWWWW